MKVRIATHNGSAVRREHNIRNVKVVDKLEHITKNGDHEIWYDERERDAYKRLFEQAVIDYNKTQTRADRRIDNYYNTVKKSVKKHTAYEMIIGVYTPELKDSNTLNKELGKGIMQEFVDDWHSRNPNLELIGAYYHADEQGQPHVHIDYIPVAHGYTRGMQTQTGLNKAFTEMGFAKKGRLTPQIQWEQRENTYLEDLCCAKGLEVEHPKKENAKHIDTETYKAEKHLETIKKDNEKLGYEQDQLNKQKADLEREIEPLQDLQKDIDAVDAKGIQLPFGFNLLSKAVLEQLKENKTKYIANRSKWLRLDEREQNIQQREQELSAQHEQLKQEKIALEQNEQFLKATARQLDETEKKLTLKEANLNETAVVQQKQTEIENLRDKVYTLTKELEQIKENQKTSIKIPLGITEIEPYAFANHTHLKEIKIPDSVTKIGEGAFANCKNLEEIFFPVNTEKIGAGAFYGCEKLSLVQLPATAEYADNTFPRGRGTFVKPYSPAEYRARVAAAEDQLTDSYGRSI